MMIFDFGPVMYNVWIKCSEEITKDYTGTWAGRPNARWNNATFTKNMSARQVSKIISFFFRYSILIQIKYEDNFNFITSVELSALSVIKQITWTWLVTVNFATRPLKSKLMSQCLIFFSYIVFIYVIRVQWRNKWYSKILLKKRVETIYTLLTSVYMTTQHYFTYKWWNY